MYEHFQEPAAYAVNLFGGPTLLSSRRAVRLSPTQGYLVAIVFGSLRDTIPRARVRSLLWKDGDHRRSRRRLSQLLYQTNQRVGHTPLILSEEDLLIPNSEVTRCDLASFQDMRKERRLRSANLLLRAGFLGNLQRTPTRAFEDWLDARRVALRSMLRDAAAATWSDCERSEQWHEAREAAEVLSDLDPAEEGVLRHVMWSRAITGAVQEAVAAYQSFSERARASSGATEWSPAPESLAMYSRIQGLDDPTDDARGVKDPEEDLDPPLCGRSKEIASLSRCFASLPQGPLSTVLVSGEAGIGKTRLVEESLKGAPLRGIRVFQARSAEIERDIPLNPILEALNQPEVESVLTRLDEPWRAILLGLMPQFHHGGGPIPEAPYIQPDRMPPRLFEAFSHLFAELVAEGPVVLFLDDLQWADDTSLAVLEALRGRWASGRLFLVAAFRPESRYVGEGSLERFLASLREGKGVEEIQLEDLSDDASRELVHLVAKRSVSQRDQDAICALGGNNPFFLIELTLEHLAGRLTTDLHHADMVPLPLSITQVLVRRFAELSETAAQVLNLMAVLDEPVTFREVAVIAELDKRSCVAAVEQLQTLRLTRRFDQGVRIKHELIRQTVYGRLSEPRKAWLHERVAQHLLNRPEPLPIGQLALHFHHAGVGDQALHFSLKASAAAETSGAVAEAARYLEIAREHARDPEEAAVIIGKLGHLHYLHRNLSEAAPILELACPRLRAHGRIPEALSYEVERADAISHGDAAPIRDVIEELQRIKEEARNRELWDIITKALDVEIHILDRVADIQGTQRVLREAEDLLDVSSPEARCSAHSILALHLFFGSPELALSSARTAVQLAEEHGLRQELLSASNRLMVVLLHNGLLGTSSGMSLVATAEESARYSGDLFLRFNLRVNVGVYHLEVGEYEQAMQAFERARKVVAGTAAKDAHLILECNLGELEFCRGDFELASLHFTRGEALLDAASPIRLRRMVKAGLGLTAMTTGDLRTAREMEEQVGLLPDYWYFDPYLLATFKARMRWHRGDRRSAILLLRQTGEAVRGRLVTSWLNLRLEESRLLRRVDMSEARQVAEEALGVARELGLSVRIREFQALTT